MTLLHMNLLWQTLAREIGWTQADVHATNHRHQTVLRLALESSACKQYVPQLLALGANPNHSHPSLAPILHTAVLYAPECISSLLANGANPFIKDSAGRNLFDLAITCSSTVIETLLSENVGVFEIRRRYYDPDWNAKIPATVKDVIKIHLRTQRSHAKSGIGQLSATQTTPNKSSSLG